MNKALEELKTNGSHDITLAGGSFDMPSTGYAINASNASDSFTIQGSPNGTTLTVSSEALASGGAAYSGMQIIGFDGQVTIKGSDKITSENYQEKFSLSGSSWTVNVTSN